MGCHTQRRIAEKEESLKDVQKKSLRARKGYYGCSQCILLAIQQVFGREKRTLFVPVYKLLSDVRDAEKL